MEVRKYFAVSAAPLQLFKYLRQIFNESVDRRFVLLAQSNVFIYLADRSGVLASEVFDMHKVGIRAVYIIKISATIVTEPPHPCTYHSRWLPN